jgi:RepB DNA-primase N-terminal domain
MTDREGARRFLGLAFEPDDWLAVFLKAYDTGRVTQRVAPLATFCEPRWQAWLRVMNAYRFNVYVSVNAMTPGLRERTKQAVRAVRHVFLDVDEDAEGVVERLATRTDLPALSCVVHSSPGRLQLLWRVRGFSPEGVERLQKWLAREVGADPAATACSQTMRLPGFVNRKHSPTPVVRVEYRAANAVYGPVDFPTPAERPDRARERSAPIRLAPGVDIDIVERAKRYLAAVPPAVAGQHGDAETFRVCCRLARGFALKTEAALHAIGDWNDRCEPPWTEPELIAKLDHARRYGREPIGGLLGARR